MSSIRETVIEWSKEIDARDQREALMIAERHQVGELLAVADAERVRLETLLADEREQSTEMRAELEAQIATATAKCVTLEARIAELEAQPIVQTVEVLPARFQNISVEQFTQGMTLINERNFDTIAAFQTDGPGAQGWDPIEGRSLTNLKVVQDPNIPAPYGPCAAQHTFPAGFIGGSSSAMQQINWAKSGKDYKTVHFRLVMALSPNFQGHKTSTNKLFHLWLGGRIGYGNQYFASAEGFGAGPLRFRQRCQGDPANKPHCPSNRFDNPEMVRGQYYTFDIVVALGERGQPDAGLVWQDGVLIGAYSPTVPNSFGQFDPLGFNKNADAFGIYQLQLAPTWGGGGDVVAQEMWIRYAHCAISAK